MSDLHKLQQQIKHLVELIQKLTMEFGAVKAELEESRVDVDSIWETLKELLLVNIHTSNLIITVFELEWSRTYNRVFLFSTLMLFCL